MSRDEDTGHHFLPSLWSSLEDVLRYHPKYGDCQGICLQELIYGNGPLKRYERLYISVMTAAHHNCKYLVDLFQREFEVAGGDAQWLSGLKANPEKRFRSLDEMIVLLSHQPWRVNADLIKRVMRDDDAVVWSLNGLVHAAVIISVVNSLCSLEHGLGNMEPSSLSAGDLTTMAFRCEWLAKNKQVTRSSTTKEVDYLLGRMQMLRKLAAEQEEAEAEGINTGFEFQTLIKEGDENASTSLYSHNFTMQPALSYVDFANRDDASKTFKIHEFDWEHGYALIEDVYPLMAKMLDDKFTLMKNLTYNTMGEYKNVDTSEYRLAIWNYIHALFGIRHDDYDYAEVNDLLSRAMKTFVKTAACFPSRVTPELRAPVMTEFATSEKIHVLLMIVEARCQANLLYFTRALSNYYVAGTRRRR